MAADLHTATRDRSHLARAEPWRPFDYYDLSPVYEIRTPSHDQWARGDTTHAVLFGGEECGTALDWDGAVEVARLHSAFLDGDAISA